MIMEPCDVILGMHNVIMGQWNMNRGPCNVIGDRGM